MTKILLFLKLLGNAAAKELLFSSMTQEKMIRTIKTKPTIVFFQNSNSSPESFPLKLSFKTLNGYASEKIPPIYARENSFEFKVSHKKRRTT